jgi:lipopolysaccharide export system protein LptC
VVTLIGGVVVSSPSGWTVEGERFTAAMDRTDLRSDLPVRATGPAGEVTSNAMELTGAAGGKSAYLLVFKGDVKLVYRPAN